MRGAHAEEDGEAGEGGGVDGAAGCGGEGDGGKGGGGQVVAAAVVGGGGDVGGEGEGVGLFFIVVVSLVGALMAVAGGTNGFPSSW